MTRTRKKKPEEDLKTLYYYRKGILRIEVVDNSKLGLYSDKYVFIRKYDKDRDQFLVEDKDGDKTWTDMVVPIKPIVDGHELYFTSFPLLVERDFREGDEVCFRTRNNFASLKKEIQNSSTEYNMERCECLNLKNIPRSFNFALGYPDGLAQIFNANLTNEDE